MRCFQYISAPFLKLSDLANISFNRILRQVNVCEFVDDFWNVWKEEELFGRMLKIMENWKILDRRWLKIKNLVNNQKTKARQSTTTTRCP